MTDFDCIVAGAGVIGLAVARKLAISGRSVLVIEAARHFGTETSSRNSEVIHAGIYYAPSSLKAELCVSGRSQLYEYAVQRGIPYRRTGKLIVAADETELPRLEAIAETAKKNGVHDIEFVDGGQASELEPALKCVGALLSPSTGIIDVHSLMQSYAADLEAHGGQIVFNVRVDGAAIDGERVSVRTRDVERGEEFELSSRLFVNAAGLAACSVAASISGFPMEHVPEMILAKGNYFSARAGNPFKRLIYPVPVDGGLGVHLTFDLGGQIRFGPDVEWITHVDYSVDPARAAPFYAEIRRYWPGLPDGVLAPAYCGIRPKLSGPGSPAADFRIDGPRQHGAGPIVNLFGIESPGITASLAIADHVESLTQ